MDLDQALINLIEQQARDLNMTPDRYVEEALANYAETLKYTVNQYAEKEGITRRAVFYRMDNGLKKTYIDGYLFISHKDHIDYLRKRGLIK